MLLAGAAACAAPEPADDEVAEPAVVAEPIGEVDAEFLPALEALQRAVAEHEDDFARLILGRILARAPTGRAAELAEAFRRILDGRRAVGELELRLVAYPSRPDGTGPPKLVLEIENHSSTDVELQPGPVTVRALLISVDARGQEQRSSATRTVDPSLEEPRLLLAADAVSRFDIGSARVPVPPGALATRGRWELVVRSGYVHVGEERLPAMNLQVEPCEVTRLAGFLPRQPLAPDELARYLTSGRLATPALLERAVRIPRSRHQEALDLLTPVVERLAWPDLELAVPALRWLSGTARPGGDPDAWRQWMAVRAVAREQGLTEPDLRLPSTYPDETEPTARMGLGLGATRSEE